eukprot:s1091_g9.t1
MRRLAWCNILCHSEGSHTREVATFQEAKLKQESACWVFLGFVVNDVYMRTLAIPEELSSLDLCGSPSCCAHLKRGTWTLSIVFSAKKALRVSEPSVKWVGATGPDFKPSEEDPIAGSEALADSLVQILSFTAFAMDLFSPN